MGVKCFSDNCFKIFSKNPSGAICEMEVPRIFQFRNVFPKGFLGTLKHPGNKLKIPSIPFLGLYFPSLEPKMYLVKRTDSISLYPLGETGENFKFDLRGTTYIKFPDSTRRGNKWKRGHNDCFKMH